MKSENIVLCVCLLFVLVVILGLLLQSCASTDRRSLSQEKSGSVSSMQHISSSDSLSFAKFFSSQDKVLTFTCREYAPVLDSAGQAVGSRLINENSVSVSDSRRQEQTDATYQQLVDNSQSHSRDSTVVVTETDKNSNPFSLYSLIRFIPIVMVFLIVAAPFFRRS